MTSGRQAGPGEGFVVAERLRLEQRTLDRLRALAMLQQEALPGVPYEVDDALQQALDRGLDLMLSELLVRREPLCIPIERPDPRFDSGL
jgi:hypothetical protein